MHLIKDFFEFLLGSPSNNFPAIVEAIIVTTTESELKIKGCNFEEYFGSFGLDTKIHLREFNKVDYEFPILSS